MTAQELLKDLERDFHLQLSGSRVKDIAERIEGLVTDRIAAHELAKEEARLSAEAETGGQQLPEISEATDATE